MVRCSTRKERNKERKKGGRQEGMIVTVVRKEGEREEGEGIEGREGQKERDEKERKEE